MHNRVKILVERYSALAVCAEDIARAHGLLEQSFRGGGQLLLCGNGGSAADCDHIAGELLKSFRHPRPLPTPAREKLGETLAGKLQAALPAIPLPQFAALGTAYANDCDAQYVFAQLVLALGRPGDVLLAITTSGNSPNILHAADTARARGVRVLGITGETGGKLFGKCDACIRVPQRETYRVQELQLPIYHCLCLWLEETFFGPLPAEK